MRVTVFAPRRSVKRRFEGALIMALLSIVCEVQPRYDVVGFNPGPLREAEQGAIAGLWVADRPHPTPIDSKRVGVRIGRVAGKPYQIAAATDDCVARRLLRPKLAGRIAAPALAFRAPRCDQRPTRF